MQRPAFRRASLVAAAIVLAFGCGAARSQAVANSDSSSVSPGGLPASVNTWSPTAAATAFGNGFGSITNTDSTVTTTVSQTNTVDTTTSSVLSTVSSENSSASSLTSAANTDSSLATSLTNSANAESASANNVSAAANAQSSAAINTSNYANAVSGNANNTSNYANYVSGVANNTSSAAINTANSAGGNPVVGFTFDPCTATTAIYKNGAQQIIWTPFYECGGGG
jgi:hypothetical protein